MISNLLSKSVNRSYYSWGDDQQSGGERLRYFLNYASLLTENQCDRIESSICPAIQRDAKYVSSRDGYAAVAKGLHMLSESCEKGKLDAKRIASKILEDNPKKPAYREEINRYHC